MIYDIIGDVHGQADKLIGLLCKLGYRYHAYDVPLNEQDIINGNTHSHDKPKPTSKNVKDNYKYSENLTKQNTHRFAGYYAPPDNHRALFIGDLIDRGEQERKTLEIAFAMKDAGVADIIMGNHEYNALAYATLNNITQDGSYLREHKPANQHQHKAFLAEIHWQSAEHQYWLQRFYELPLWLETDHACFVHACWDTESMQVLRSYLTNNNLLTSEGLQATGQKHSQAYVALERVLKGVETTLPNGMYITDKGGRKRHNVRVKWWLDRLNERPIQEIARVPKSDEVKLESIPQNAEQEKIDFQLTTKKPIFIGHYWMRGLPAPLSQQVVCTDYSAAIDAGYLTCYQFDTQHPLPLSSDNFIWFNHHR